MKPIKNFPGTDFQAIFIINKKLYVIHDKTSFEIIPEEIELNGETDRFIYSEIDEDSGYTCPWYIDIDSKDLKDLVGLIERLWNYSQC